MDCCKCSPNGGIVEPGVLGYSIGEKNSVSAYELIERAECGIAVPSCCGPRAVVWRGCRPVCPIVVCRRSGLDCMCPAKPDRCQSSCDCVTITGCVGAALLCVRACPERAPPAGFDDVPFANFVDFLSVLSSLLIVATELFLLFLDRSSSPSTFVPSTFLSATGQASPRSLPRLATPTPHVKVVL